VRIVFLSWRDLAHPQAGGSEYVVDRLASSLTDRGHNVTLLCGGPVGRRHYAAIDTGGRFSQYLRAPFVAKRLPRADVIVDVENGIPFFAPLWTRTPVVCLVLHVHTDQWDMYFPKPIARVGYALEHWLMPRAYRHCPFVAISSSTAEALTRIGIDGTRVETVVMGTDAPHSLIARSSREPMFVVLGRLVPHKRVELALQLWARVRPVTGGTLVIVGEGPERPRLERLAGEGVAFTGHVSEHEKHQLIEQAWLLIHPAAHEGWGMVIMEAAAASTPAIGFDVPGVRDSIAHHQTGLLARNEEEFIDSWITLASDARLRDEFGERACVRARSFDWATAVDKFEAVLGATVDGAERPGSTRSR
jgi:glycosyltransferase involved in cell wall biosynthesis